MSSTSHAYTGTNGGVVVNFDSVEIVYRIGMSHVWETVKNYSADFATMWVTDPVHHEVRSTSLKNESAESIRATSQVNQLCSRLTLHEAFISRFSELDEM